MCLELWRPVPTTFTVTVWHRTIDNVMPAYPKGLLETGDKIISILHLSCRTSDLQFSLVLHHTHLSFKSLCNKEHIKRSNMTSPSNSSQSRTSAFVKNYSSFLDFTRNYERTSGIFCPLERVLERETSERWQTQCWRNWAKTTFVKLKSRD